MSGIKPGEPVIRTGQTLSVQLGPGLLTQIYDGIQRPLEDLEETMGAFITRGVDADGLDLKKKRFLRYLGPNALGATTKTTNRASWICRLMMRCSREGLVATWLNRAIPMKACCTV